MTGSSHSADAPPTKRQKVEVACDLCRSKKIKCDSVRPVCGPCLKKESNSLRCSWEGNLSRSQQTSRAEVLRLKRRIEELESHALVQRGGTHTSIRHNDVNSGVEASEVQIVQAPNQRPASVIELGSPTTTRPTEYTRDQMPTTPVSPALTQPSVVSQPTIDRALLRSAAVPSDSASRTVRSSSGDHQFFGAPSAVSFLGQMRNAIQQKLGLSETMLPEREDLQSAVLGANIQSGTRALDYVLPARRRADKLLSLYWDIVHPLYPFLDRQDFLAQYDALWKSQESDKDDPVFLCSLNLIFALSSQLDEDVPPEARQSSADVFYERAKGSLDLWNLDTLQCVQMLLLLSIHLQSSCVLNPSWMIIGVAIRTAQSLGLHHGETSTRIASHKDRELSRRVWHTCVLLDRMAAMTYGRPSMIIASLDTQVPLPLSVDEGSFSAGQRLLNPDPRSPSTVEFFVQSLRLFDILAEVLIRFYPGHHEKGCAIQEQLEKFLGKTAADSRESILETDRRLREWERNLPTQLKIDQSSLDSGISYTFTSQAVILRQRFLHIRLLALRPLLSAYLGSESGGSSGEAPKKVSLSERIAAQCSVVCVEVAQEMIDFDYKRRPSNANLVGRTAAWWQNALFIYSAATVLVAARLSPSIMSEISEDSIMQSWSLAIEVLKSFQVFNPLIQRCISALELIHRVIPERYASSRHHTHEFVIEDEESHNMSFQSQFHGVGLSGQGLPYAAPHAGEQGMEGLMDHRTDGLLDNSLLFGMDDFSWLSVAPFQF
ncbi:hypothetical protein T440DRAFT_512370 [Plenodomus tracheiphilus IPT5]|uniref:Zn(2)-C6 fungal-type domain-containing protein n=1 Tax=Plenodomus tracheiphilus IPT5 TaxID=1408161 RepID=A0A6A7APN6_9PLEO|nr:hypothetical protein T440DRAFT_512370 [Plenodomus tracheiphilus IPT5]